MGKRGDWLGPMLMGTSALAAAVTLLSLSRRSHWIFRMGDFPRVQLAALAAASGAAYAAFCSRNRPRDYIVMAADAAVVAWQLARIYTYTPLASPTVQRAASDDADPDSRIVLMITNVQMENEHHERLLDLVAEVDPDVLLAVEVDDAWARALDRLADRYAYAVRHPRDNWYGMQLLSKLELVEPQIEFLVQDDVPSLRTCLRLRSGVEVVLRGLHPRPPEPIRDQPSAPRDAELVAVGRDVGRNKDVPTIVAGDLNDVAWSDTSQLFVRLSGLLDPRAGRGFFNSYNAHSPLFRYPLDHVFHSRHFKLVRLERLRAIGSDHFPILIELQFDPHAAREQEESHERPGDERRADEKLEQEAEAAATNADRSRE
ncbi:MAG TPA: endonuclease/exonuclease/phosphatase family protein [Thermoanaerobaculia bacterium]|nr:endonuclease/exonuclease/phosphatase family protein [Thermoanaerobaculia bacterium]